MAAQSTKSQSLALLKRSGAGSVGGLASVLERDNLLTAREFRRPTGRRRFLYSLTDKGEGTFHPRKTERL